MPRAAKRKCPCGCGQPPHETTRERRIECTGCGYAVRASRLMISRGMPTCVCGWDWRAVCLHDRALYDETAMSEVIANGERGYRGSGTGGERRLKRLGAYVQDRCSACHRFVRSARDRCEHCGYHPEHGYSDAVPF